MFSVSASPFNSAARQLYGGWAGVAAPEGSRGSYQALRNYYATHPNSWYRDSKWASMAIKYSPNRNDLALAKLIKKAGKDQMEIWRQNAAWKEGYAAAMARMRSPVVRRKMTDTEKLRTWLTFTNRVPYGRPTAAGRTWLSLATKGPYTSPPAVAGDVIPQAILDTLSVGPLAAPPEARYTTPEGAIREAYNLPMADDAMADDGAADNGIDVLEDLGIGPAARRPRVAAVGNPLN